MGGAVYQPQSQMPAFLSAFAVTGSTPRENRFGRNPFEYINTQKLILERNRLRMEYLHGGDKNLKTFLSMMNAELSKRKDVELVPVPIKEEQQVKRDVIERPPVINAPAPKPSTPERAMVRGEKVSRFESSFKARRRPLGRGRGHSGVMVDKRKPEVLE